MIHGEIQFLQVFEVGQLLWNVAGKVVFAKTQCMKKLQLTNLSRYVPANGIIAYVYCRRKKKRICTALMLDPEIHIREIQDKIIILSCRAFRY